MWLRYVKRAAAYNIDLAQHFYVEAMNNGEVPDPSVYDYIAWTRIENDSNGRNEKMLSAFAAGMSAQLVAREEGRALVIGFEQGRVDFGGITQLVMLAPGKYQFNGKYTGELVGQREVDAIRLRTVAQRCVEQIEALPRHLRQPE